MFFNSGQENNHNEQEVSEVFLKRYLFACITSFFGKHIICQSKQRQYGVLLYRRGTDLGEVLSKTLYLMKESSMRLLDVENSESDVDTELFSFCNSINKRIHQQINTTTKQDAQKT